ncbi:MAG: nickel-dependent lactate racemase family protein [Candidatus Limnocylindrales bacterium]
MVTRVPAGTAVRLSYGRGSLEAILPIEADIISPRYGRPLADPVGALEQAFARPGSGPALAELVVPGARVGVAVCDVTRPFPARLVLPVLLDAIPTTRVTVFVATGTHRACTEDELDAMLGPAVRARVEVVQHDAFDPLAHAPVGPIPGSDVVASVDRRFLAQDVRITLGFIEPHFFAGFSGGPKMVVPGLASIETVLELHSAVRLADPRATFGTLAGNPVHEGISAAAAATGVDFALDVTLDADHRITGIHAGRPYDEHARGCEVVRETAMEPVDIPYDVVVTTNSGYPLDQNLYQAVKGICAAAGIVRDGGAILLAAECADGLPAHSRYGALLRAHRDAATFLRALATGELHVHDQWQVQKQALVLRRVRVLVHAGGLSDDEIRAAWFEPAGDLSSALTGLVAGYGPACRLAVLPEGPQSIAYLR